METPRSPRVPPTSQNQDTKRAGENHKTHQTQPQSTEPKSGEGEGVKKNEREERKGGHGGHRGRGGTEKDEENERDEGTGGHRGRRQQSTTRDKDLKTLKLLYMNAQSVISKINELKITVCDLQPDIVLITESWCNKNINNSVIKLCGYELCTELRRDRTDTTNGIGGGLLVYIKDGRSVLPCDTDSNFNQFCKFMYKSEKESLNFYLIYRPPSSSQENLNELTKLLQNNDKNCFFIGDFNLPEIDWTEYTGPRKYQTFLDTCQEFSLEQMVDFPTHKKGNMLDLVLTNNPDIVILTEDCGRLGTSDHSMIYIELNCTINNQGNQESRRHWRGGDYDQIKQDIENVSWEEELLHLDTEQAWNYFTSIVNRSIENNVPLTKNLNRNQPVWMTRDLLRKVRKKRRVWKQYKLTGAPRHYDNYKELELSVKKSVKNAKKNYERKIANNSKDNRAFNRYIKNNNSCKETIGPLKTSTKTITNNEKEMAEILNTYFSSVFTQETSDEIPTPESTNCMEEIYNIKFTRADIVKTINKLKPSNSSGPDGITVNLLQKLPNIFAVPLEIILNRSMEEGKVPQDWKDAFVVPIFKKGIKANPSNYRPVSLTSIICKVMETLIKDHMMDFLLRYNLLRVSQHGFLPKKSCLSNLLEFLEVITKVMDDGDPVDILYLDFSKAFDKVPHKRLICKLEAMNIRGNIRTWIENWLKGRRQRVVINGIYSIWQLVLSGVPQGSVLGPLLFIIFINDLDVATEGSLVLKKFADDTKLANMARNSDDHNKMQSYIDNLVNWSKKWGMEFNKEKCKIMHCGSNNPGHIYTMENQPLSTTDEERDIGVIINKNLKPSKQCEAAANRARAVLNQISRTFHYRDQCVFKRLYVTYVRPHLEFSVPAWSPTLAQDISILESVQTKAVNMISGLKGNTYNEKLQQLGIQSLETRRNRFDLIQVYKIINNLVDVNSSQWFQKTSEVSTRSTRQATDPNALVIQRTRTLNRQSFFSIRAAESWNTLPAKIKSAATLQQFKNKLDEHLPITVERP